MAFVGLDMTAIGGSDVMEETTTDNPKCWQSCGTDGKLRRYKLCTKTALSDKIE